MKPTRGTTQADEEDLLPAARARGHDRDRRGTTQADEEDLLLRVREEWGDAMPAIAWVQRRFGLGYLDAAALVARLREPETTLIVREPEPELRA